MPLMPTALSALIKTQLLAVPIGTAPLSTTVSQTSNPDGSTNTVCTPSMGPVFLNATLAQVIADAVANAVVAHIISAGLVVGTCSVSPVTGKLT